MNPVNAAGISDFGFDYYFASEDSCNTVTFIESRIGSGAGMRLGIGTEIGSGSGTGTRILYDEEKDYEDANETAEAYRNTVDKLMEDIEKINQEIADQSVLIEEARKSLDDMDAEIAAAEQEVEDIEAEIAYEREQLSNVISYMYENSGDQDIFAVTMKASSITNILNRGEYVSSITDYVTEKLKELEKKQDEADDKKFDLVLLQENRHFDLEDYENRQAELSAQIVELGEMVKEAEQKAEDAEAFAESLRTRIVEIQAKEREILYGKKYNGDMSNVVYDGDGTDYYYTAKYPYTDEELTLMAGIIEAEAGSVSYPGMIAVGSVVMNRVESPNFSNTIAGVIYSPYQFEPASTGSLALILARGPAAACYQAAQEVLEGKRNVPNYYFKAAWYAEAHGISGVNIGGNVFH